MTFWLPGGVLSHSSNFHHQGGVTSTRWCSMCILEALSQVCEVATLYVE